MEARSHRKALSRNENQSQVIVMTAILSLVGCSQQDEKETAKDDKKVFTFSWSGDNGDVV